MARAVAARLQGDDYQIRFFWLQACRLFEDRTKVVNVEMESDDTKSLDDVVVRYRDYSDMGESIDADFIQVKFHVTGNGAFTWERMMDPDFVNAKSVSILQRLLDAQRKHAPKGCGCRFIIYSPWIAHPDNELAAFHSLSDGRFRWDVLIKGGPNSKMGKVRTQWKQHIGLSSDDELRLLLNLVRLRHGPMLDKLSEDLYLRLRLAGLAPPHCGNVVSQYDGLGRDIIKSGVKVLNRDALERLCRERSLWVGRTVEEPDALRVGIRSFWRYAEHLEDETDMALCLLRHFDGRFPKSPDAWNKIIVPELVNFLRANITPPSSYHIRLQTHGSIAFLAGWELNPKSGIDIVPVQDSLTGRHVWRNVPVSPDIEKQYPSWEVIDSKLESTDGPDAVLAVSATHDIEMDVLKYIGKNVGTAGHIIHCRLVSSGHASVKDGTHAYLLVQRLVAAVRELRSGQGGMLHIFFAAPNGLMFLFGRHAHVLGKLLLYEHDFEAGGAEYYPAISIPPAGDSKLGMSERPGEDRK